MASELTPEEEQVTESFKQFEIVNFILQYVVCLQSVPSPNYDETADVWLTTLVVVSATSND